MPDISEGMALEVVSKDGMLWLYKSTEETEPWFSDDVGRFRLIPWPMTAAEKFERLAEALGDGFRLICTGHIHVVVGDYAGKEVCVFLDGDESYTGPRDFNRRAIALLDQLQIGSDDVAAMVGGEGV